MRIATWWRNGKINSSDPLNSRGSPDRAEEGLSDRRMDHDLGRAQVVFPGDATVKGLVWRACRFSDCRYAALGRLGCMNRRPQRCQGSANVISPRPEASR